MSICPVHDSNWVLCAKVSLKNGTKIAKKKKFLNNHKTFFYLKDVHLDLLKLKQSHMIQSSSKVACRSSLISTLKMSCT